MAPPLIEALLGATDADADRLATVVLDHIRRDFRSFEGVTKARLAQLSPLHEAAVRVVLHSINWDTDRVERLARKGFGRAVTAALKGQ